MSDDVKLHQTMDGVVWAREFIRITGGTMDEETAIGWFCNAIMCGWDHRTWQTPEYKASLAAAQNPEQLKTEREAFIERVEHWDSIKAASVLLTQSEIAMVAAAFRETDKTEIVPPPSPPPAKPTPAPAPAPAPAPKKTT